MEDLRTDLQPIQFKFSVHTYKITPCQNKFFSEILNSLKKKKAIPAGSIFKSKKGAWVKLWHINRVNPFEMEKSFWH